MHYLQFKRFIMTNIDLSYFLEIVKYPIITDKATRLIEENQYSFFVDPKANKSVIKKAIEYIFDVQVIKVNTFHPPKKRRTLSKFIGYKPHYKRAIVKLDASNSINLFPNE
uniref:Ribosomal protein L23 n=1 Tax=Porphyridium sordidum TaxID=28024 RepID=A0A1C9CE86_PORSO|nr:ribosomal protein L23 [Porphyridium sordidum]AOM66664.1 ribosomal protein L23 [Porphyridium sordidum]